MSPSLLRASVLFAALTTLAATAHPTAMKTPRQDAPQVVRIDAERFSFSPSELRVKAGAPVEIRLRSDDTNHGFRIIGTDVNVIIPKRGKGEATVMFQPPKAGRYVFECSKLCGAGHAFMRGALIVE